ncbi:ABC transporter permease [Paratractidigestivibacter sp.]|uniref:ABC transporter permease n=1 Tax=Paratractidigestivibacter sp. TaxID=2847316 RepID=UPI002AC9CA20|nr:ABC transporter permease [Paratractidigestivibacter sp.]
MASNNTAVADPKAVETKKSFDFAQIQTYLPFAAFAIIVIFFAVATGGNILTPKNLTLILSGGYMLMIGACGIWLIMTMGCLDFSMGSELGICCAVFCYLSQTNLALALVGSIATGAAISLVNALLHVKGQIASFVVTNCTMFLLRGVVQLITTANPVYAATYVQADFNDMGILMGITIAVLIVTFVLTRFTSIGHNLKAIGANEKAARFAGIKVQKTKILVYVVAGCIIGLAAFVNAIKVGSVTASSGNMFETKLLIAMVLGGMPINGGARARFSNIVVGVLSYLVLEKGLVMLGLTTEMQQLFLGIVFVGLVALFSDRSSNQVIK